VNDALVFPMGKFDAHIPTDRRYAKNHMWALPQGQGFQCGFTAYAVRLLQDVYFLEWFIDPGTPIKFKQTLGQIESSKAESELYAPFAGVLTQFNEELLSDPATINVDKYGRGWLFHIETAEANLLTPEEYLVHLQASWEVAQRAIKGQINQDD